MELVVFRERQSPRRAGFHRLIALIVDNGERAIGCDRVQLLGNQHVEIFVVAFQRGEAVRIPADVKSGAQWVVAGGNLADVGDAAPAAFARRQVFGVLLDLKRAVDRPRVRQQAGGKLNARRRY